MTALGALPVLVFFFLDLRNCAGDGIAFGLSAIGPLVKGIAGPGCARQAVLAMLFFPGCNLAFGELARTFALNFALPTEYVRKIFGPYLINVTMRFSPIPR